MKKLRKLEFLEKTFIYCSLCFWDELFIDVITCASDTAEDEDEGPEEVESYDTEDNTFEIVTTEVFFDEPFEGSIEVDGDTEQE